MGSEDAKRLILARRARFVAAALAGVAAACGGQSEGPEPCLSIARDAAPEPEPQPCLAPLPPDASIDAAKDADASADADAEPQPCLSPLPPDGGDGG